jgi:hypothetical protein
VLSQRLQELPPPHGEGSEPASGQGSPRTQSGEMPFLIDFDQRQRVSASVKRCAAFHEKKGVAARSVVIAMRS